MVNPDWYIKPVEQMMMENKITIWYQSYRKDGFDNLGQPKYITCEQWWVATMKKSKKQGEGANPREAIIDLYKKLE